MIPVLRSTLITALQQVGVADDPEFWGWKRIIKQACFEIIGNQLPDSDPNVDLIRRVARQLKQAGEILWEQPETPEQAEAEHPYVDRIAQKEARLEARAVRTRKITEARTTPILTEDEKAFLRDPNTLLALNGRVGAWARRFSVHLPPKLTSFRWNDIGRGWSRVDSSAVVARMIRHGILDLIERHPYHAYACMASVQLGPKYLAYMLRWGQTTVSIQRGNWESLVQGLNAKWNTNFDPEDWYDGPR
jgi:hypothetical protein